jgi:hypothetical protein
MLMWARTWNVAMGDRPCEMGTPVGACPSFSCRLAVDTAGLLLPDEGDQALVVPRQSSPFLSPFQSQWVCADGY